MKLRMRDRILAAVLGLFALLCGAIVLVHLTGIAPFVTNYLRKVFQLGGWMRWILIALSALLMLVGLRGIALLFRRRVEKGFVMQRTENGDISISMKALEGLIRRCVSQREEISVQNIRIFRTRMGISVEMKVVLPQDTNIPLVVSALQKQVKMYVTDCSGIDVDEVRVKVELDQVKLLPTPEEKREEAPIPQVVVPPILPEEPKEKETPVLEIPVAKEETEEEVAAEQTAEPNEEGGRTDETEEEAQ